jgi:hypothetical protein
VGIAFRVSGVEHISSVSIFVLTTGDRKTSCNETIPQQHISVPGFPWNKLRTESPGKCESYLDLVAGQWTKVRLQVSGTSARLYVNGAAQPTLVVNDLKQPPAKGAIALWVGPGTIAHFSVLKVFPEWF